MILAGTLIGFGAALCGYFFARAANRRMPFELPIHPADGAPASEPGGDDPLDGAETHPLPPLALAVAPVVLPLVLIGLQESLKHDTGPIGLALRTLGHTDMALLLGAIAALLLVARYRPREGSSKTVQTALAHAAMVVLITA